MSLRDNPFSALAEDDSPVPPVSPSPPPSNLTIEPVSFVDDTRFKEWSRHPSPSIFNSRKKSEVFPPSFVKYPQVPKNIMEFPPLNGHKHVNKYTYNNMIFSIKPLKLKYWFTEEELLKINS